MPKSEDQKKKLLFLKTYLEENTDPEHPITAVHILDYYTSLGLACDRKTVYSDIRALQESGVSIDRYTGRHGGYYIDSRDFSLPELKLLVDAVQSCKFLTDKKSMELIGRLSKLCSKYEAKQLQRTVAVSGRAKTMDNSVVNHIDHLQAAINANRQIMFRYFSWGPDGKRVYKASTRVASPYFLVWDDENYYLVAHTAEHGITHFRVDKMSHIVQLEEERTVTEETKKLTPTVYGQSVFGMYGGRKETVRLRFRKGLAGVVIDRFGQDVMLIPDGDEHFVFKTDVYVSPMFFGWLANFGCDAEILSPDDLRDEYRSHLLRALSVYEND